MLIYTMMYCFYFFIKIYIKGRPFIYNRFIVAKNFGNGKPACIRNYLQQFKVETNDVLKHGVMIRNKVFQIRIKGFVGDKPARSYIKCVKGFCACERCEVYGERCDRTTVYPDLDSPKRTNETFCSQKDPEHHHKKIKSPLLDIDPPIDMVLPFMIEFMHGSCMGVMKKLIDYWSSNKKHKRKYVFI